MEPMNLSQFLVQKIKKTPDKVYLQFEQQKITYSQLYDRASLFAAGMLELGIQRDDKVCLMLNNSPEYLDAWFALSFLGAVAVPLNVHLKGEGLQYILNHSDCKLILVDQEYIPQIMACLPAIQRKIQLVVTGSEGNQMLEMKEQGVSAAPIALLQSATRKQSPDLTLSPSAINSILYTSGTTGLPKGAMLSHGAYVKSGIAFAEHMIGAVSDDILFTTLPLFHINAQAHTTLGAISANATVALSKRFSASRFWDEIRKHQATIFNSLGSMITILCKQPEKENDWENPARLTACAATPKEFWEPFEKRFGLRIVEGYGLTETTGFCISNPFQANRPPSIGRPYDYVETKIVDESGNELPSNEIGEILIRSNEEQVLMNGYYKMPEKTKEVMKDGWFYTGDRGYADKDGYLYFCDRIKQCIRRRGENISSWEIEKVVNQHPKVIESAAVGVPSELGEEDVKLYVILRSAQSMKPEEVLDWCQPRMAYFMVPRYIQFVDVFPKTATERIQKFKLKAEGIGLAWDREKTGYVVSKTNR
jgi:carnitine-CoA ligase